MNPPRIVAVAVVGRPMDALVDLIGDLIKETRGLGAPDELPAANRGHQRRFQSFLDFVEAGNSNGLHTPRKAARILTESINAARTGRIAIRAREGPTARPLPSSTADEKETPDGP